MYIFKKQVLVLSKLLRTNVAYRLSRDRNSAEQWLVPQLGKDYW